MALAQKVATRPAVASRRGAVVVRASAESRRAVLGGLLAGTVVALTANKAQAAAPVLPLSDDRKAKATGYELIYEARDLDLPQNVRDGFTQARANLEETKARVKESEARIDSAIEPSIKKAYWVEAREELRRQVGTLRFDLNTLVSTKGVKAEKKKAQELSKEFIKKVEDLDFALREKDGASALKKLEATKTALDSVLASIL